MTLDEYRHQPAFAFDTETHLMGMGKLIPPVVCASVSLLAADGTVDSGLQVKPDIRPLFEVLCHTEAQVVAHNAAFDLVIIAGHCPDLLPTIFKRLVDGHFEDTIIREKLLHLTDHGNLEFMPLGDTQMKLGYSLADLAKRYLGKDRSDQKEGDDAWRTNYEALDGMSLEQWPAEAKQYALEDAEDCLRIREMQEHQRLKIWQRCGHDPFETQGFQVMCSFALYLISAWGFVTDPVAKDAITAELAEAMKHDKMPNLIAKGILRPGEAPRAHKNDPTKFTKGSGDSINKKALIEYVTKWAHTKGVELKRTAPSDKFPDGQVSTGIEFFDEWFHDDIVFEEYRTRQKLMKLVSTEIPRLEWPKGSGITSPVVHPCYNVLVSSGRTSSYATDKYPSFNSQNADPRVRGCFVPRPGNVMFSIDYNGMELCTLGQKIIDLFGKSTHADNINKGIDNHTFLGSQLAFNLDTAFHESCQASGNTTQEAVYAAFLKCKKHPDPAVQKFFAHYRKFAKPTGLGYPGGLGPETFRAFAKGSYGISVDLEMATRLREIWHITYPEMKAYFRWIANDCVDPVNSSQEEGDKYAYTSPMGMYRAGCSYAAAANGAALQTKSAEGAKFATFQVVRACYDNSLCSILFGKMRVLAFIHDEIVGEVPDTGEAHDLVMEAARIMCEAFSIVTPDVVAKAQPVLMRRWNKFAEPAYDKNNRLIPWEPEKGK